MRPELVRHALIRASQVIFPTKIILYSPFFLQETMHTQKKIDTKPIEQGVEGAETSRRRKAAIPYGRWRRRGRRLYRRRRRSASPSSFSKFPLSGGGFRFCRFGSSRCRWGMGRGVWVINNPARENEAVRC